MKVIKWAFAVLIFAVFLVSHVQAQELIVYPAKGQSNEQMEKDKFECYSWAKGQTGFDPMQMPTASSPPPHTPTHLQNHLPMVSAAQKGTLQSWC